MTEFNLKNLSPAEKARISSKSSYNYKLKLPGLLRLGVAVLLFGLEAFFLAWLALSLTGLGLGILGGLQVLALLFSLYLFQKPNRTSYTVFWMIIILFFPALGFLLYFFWGQDGRFTKQRKRFASCEDRLAPYRQGGTANLADLDPASLDTADRIQLRFLTHKGFPLYRDTRLTYAATGESQFTQMFQDIEQAKDFIFLEYFIIADGFIWEKTVDLLLAKADEGLEIRLFYDDFGTTTRAGSDTMTQLRKHGVKISNFNPVARYVSGLYRNYRNHQKAAIIDGKIAWIGGTNLADEYANIHRRFGYWKDTALRIEGPACRALTADFLLLWDLEGQYPPNESYDRFMPPLNEKTEALEAGRPNLPTLASGRAPETPASQASLDPASGLLVPFWDGPLGREDNPASDLIASLISTAEKRLYISTPYLVPENSMRDRIMQAAQSGVEVFILMPGVPDKKLVYKVSQSNYYPLLAAGCRIFQYTPGFLHAKTFLADGKRAIVGSVNFDYRSLYLNFENAVYVCEDPVLQDIEADMQEIIASSEEITLDTWIHRPWPHKVLECVLKPFSPLL